MKRRLDEAVEAAPLFDTLGWVRNFEKLCGAMWQAHVAGKAPVQYLTVDDPVPTEGGPGGRSPAAPGRVV